MLEVEQFLDQIRQGTSTEQQAILNVLSERAQRTGAAEDWNRFAMGLHAAGRSDDAIAIFEQLVHHFPEDDIYRLNLATIYTQNHQFEMSRYHLQYLADHGTTMQAQTIARERLENLIRILEETEEDLELQRLQEAALRERINTGSPSADDYNRLARKLVRRQLRGDEDALHEAIAVLEAGRARFPNAGQILELLATCYFSDNSSDRREAALKDLERLDPSSPVLAALQP